MGSLKPYQASAIQTIVWETWNTVMLEALPLLLINWKEIKRVGLPYPSISGPGVAYRQKRMRAAGFEPDGIIELEGVVFPIRWYNRSR